MPLPSAKQIQAQKKVKKADPPSKAAAAAVTVSKLSQAKKRASTAEREMIALHIQPEFLDLAELAFRKQKRLEGSKKEMDRSYYIQEAMVEWMSKREKETAAMEMAATRKREEKFKVERVQKTTYVEPVVLEDFIRLWKRQRRLEGDVTGLDRSYYIEEAIKEWMLKREYPVTED